MIVLDGGLGTELERRGYDLSGGDWSARMLADDPAAVVAVHADFLAAGAQVLTTATYQATDPGQLARGVAVAREAVSRSGTAARVAGSVGPYGAMLGDLSEFTGAYLDDVSPARLAQVHRPRVAALAAAGADLVACETVPALAEFSVLARALDEVEIPGWVSLTTVVDGAGVVRTRRGEPAEDAYASVRDIAAVIAVGVNCTEPDGVEAAIRVASEASGKPVYVYPNSGETNTGGTWSGEPTILAAAARWSRAGAVAVGGCCRVGPDLIAALVAAMGPRSAGT